MTGFTKSEFDLLVRLVQPEIYPHPGKRRVIEKLDDQLFLLINFFPFGSPTVSHLIKSPFLKTQDATLRFIHSILQSVKVSLSDVFLMFGPYRIRGMKEVALVLDCTVLPENKTGKEFNCGSDCFSGKYKIYCVKVEVGVNPKTGTASTVSKVHGGAVHDYVVFREHYSQFAAHLEGGKITADSAYIGATIELGTIITKPVWTPELAAHRVIVKRFFGRLKTLITIFRRPWPLKISSIAEYFYVASCFTNNHILQNLLSEADFEAHQLFLSDLITKVEQKRQKKELANEKYRARLLNRLNPSSTPTSSVTSLHALEDTDATNEHQTQIKEKKGKSSGDQKVVLAMNEDTRISSISERDEASANSSSVLFPPIQNLYSSSNETSSSSTTQPASSASPQPPTTILISDQTTPSHSSELQSSQETFMNEGVISTNTSHLTSSPTSIFSQPSTSSSIETHPSFHSSQPTLGKQKPSSLLSQPRSLNLEQLMPSKKIHCHHSSIHPPSSTQFIQTEHNQSPDNDCLCIAKAPAKSCKNQKVPSSKQYQHKRTVLEYLLNVNSS